MYPAPACTNLHRANRDASQKCCSIKGTKRRCGEDTVESRDMLGLGRPLDRRMVQSSFDHFVLQPIGVLTNCGVRHELLLIRSISLDLLSNVFVEMNQPFVRHVFDAHDQLLLLQLNATFPSPSTPARQAKQIASVAKPRAKTSVHGF